MLPSPPHSPGSLDYQVIYTTSEVVITYTWQYEMFAAIHAHIHMLFSGTTGAARGLVSPLLSGRENLPSIRLHTYLVYVGQPRVLYTHTKYNTHRSRYTFNTVFVSCGCPYSKTSSYITAECTYMYRILFL